MLRKENPILMIVDDSIQNDRGRHQRAREGGQSSRMLISRFTDRRLRKLGQKDWNPALREPSRTKSVSKHSLAVLIDGPISRKCSKRAKIGQNGVIKVVRTYPRYIRYTTKPSVLE